MVAIILLLRMFLAYEYIVIIRMNNKVEHSALSAHLILSTSKPSFVVKFFCKGMPKYCFDFKNQSQTMTLVSES